MGRCLQVAVVALLVAAEPQVHLQGLDLQAVQPVPIRLGNFFFKVIHGRSPFRITNVQILEDLLSNQAAISPPPNPPPSEGEGEGGGDIIGLSFDMQTKPIR